ncbi:hypothetical protein GCM10009616_35780 [Microlunatus lacustris]
MQVDVSQLLTFASHAEREGALMAARAVDAVTDATSAGADMTRAWAPVGETGRLRASITTKVVGTGRVSGSVRGTIRADVPYSWYVAAGTARSRPNDFADRGRDRAESVLLQRLERAAGQAFR